MKMKRKTKQKRIAFERGEYTVRNLTVGILSDAQLPPLALRSKPSDYEKNLTDALVSMKNLGVNVVLFAGDICNLASKRAYAAFRRSFVNAYGKKLPIVRCIMGNHDYWGKLRPPSGMRELFRKSLGQSPFWHITVNGFHFIGASPLCGHPSNAYRKIVDAVKNEIERALRENPDKPVFVTTHNAAPNTIYTADTKCDRAVYDMLKHYEQVVNFSGHTHYSVLDPRSVHQKDFTSVGTQSVSYVELGSKKINGPVPPLATEFPKGTILTIGENEFLLRRIDLKSGKEETGSRRVFPLPLKKEGFLFAERIPSSAPRFLKRTGESYTVGTATYLRFPRAVSTDVVISYVLEWSDGTRQNYYGDFYLGCPVTETEETVLKIYNKKRGVYSVNVFAVDSFGTKSRDFCRIENVSVSGFHRNLARWKEFGECSILRLF